MLNKIEFVRVLRYKYQAGVLIRMTSNVCYMSLKNSETFRNEKRVKLNIEPTELLYSHNVNVQTCHLKMAK